MEETKQTYHDYLQTEGRIRGIAAAIFKMVQKSIAHNENFE